MFFLFIGNDKLSLRLFKEELVSCENDPLSCAHKLVSWVNKFKEVFESLYNSVSDQAALELVETRLKNLLTTEDNQAEINKVSPEIVKEAAAMMKSHKLDVSQGFSSDALLNAPDILFEQLALIFKDWLTHGRISKTFFG